MPLPLTDLTPLRLRIADAECKTTAGLFLADHEDDPDFDRDGVRAALERGEVYRGGGGAAPEWSVELAQ